ncbi:MAG: DNA polymerase [Gammaproteobacteria bacterium]
MNTYPDLSNVRRICIDLESHNPRLKTHGPRFVQGEDFIVGVALAWEMGDGEAAHTLSYEDVRFRGDRMDRYASLYLPWRHQENNIDIEASKDFLLSLNDGREIVGANLHFDLEGLRAEGVTFPGCVFRDIQIAESLIDDNARSLSLDTLAQKYLGERKSTDELQAIAKELLGKKADAYENMHRLPVEHVAKYARRDAELALRVFAQQRIILAREGLNPAFDLESALMHYVQDCRFRGIRIDEEAAHVLLHELEAEAKEARKTLYSLAGKKDVDIWSAASVVHAAEELSLKLPLSANGKPVIQGGWLDKQTAMFWKALRLARQLDRAGHGFVKSIINQAHNGRLYYQLVQSRDEEGGASSFRFSSRNPNMQNMHARDEQVASRIRSIFLPEPGEVWVSFDESQIEVRIAVHYAALLELTGAADAVKEYNDDPSTDFHAWVAKLTGIDRREGKGLFFSMLYGAGPAKVAEMLGITGHQASTVISHYNMHIPFAKQLSDRCSALASSRGWIKTIGHRRRRFDLYGPTKYTPGMLPQKYDEAVKVFPNTQLTKYFTYRALNALVQGSAADIHKRSLLDVYRAGLPLCILPIHDELNFSLADLRMVDGIKRTILEGYTLKVPRLINVKAGATFGTLREVI